jgi:hypothetical protein
LGVQRPHGSQNRRRPARKQEQIKQHEKEHRPERDRADVRNCTRDEGGPFEVGNQELISSHRKLLSSKAMVVNVAEKSERDFGRYD